MQIKRPVCSIILLLLFVIACMNCHFSGSSYVQKRNELPEMQSKEEYITLVGNVKSKEYKLTFGKERLIVLLETETLKQSGGKRNRQQVMCYMQEVSHEPYIGQRIMVQGRPEVYLPATNPGEFDSYKYYQIIKISYKLSNVKILSESKTFSAVKENLYRVKRKLSFLIDNSFGAKEAGILKAMLLGDKSTLDTEIKELYQLSGMIHILAISGVHISIIGMSVYKMLHKCMLPKALSIPMAIVLMVLYGMMTGAAVSCVRAIFMFGLKLLAELAGRTYDMVTAVSLIAAIILWQQPFYMGHSGFMLSFGAVMGLLFVMPWIKELTDGRVMKRNGIVKWIRNGIISGFSIAIATLPIQLHFYYVYPITSLIANLIVIPLVGVLLVNGSLTVLINGACIKMTRVSCSMSAENLGRIIEVLRKPSEWILAIYEEIGKISAKVQGGIWVIGKPFLWQIIIYYLVVMGMIVYQKYYVFNKKNEEKQYGIPQYMQILVLLVAICFLCRNPREGFEVHFLDVGQGDCIVVVNDNRNAYMIDGGSTSRLEVGNYQIVPFLKYMGIKELEAVFITHPDEDHINGIMEMMQTDSCQIAIKRLILPDVAQNLKDTELIKLRALAAESDIPVYYMHCGERLRDGVLDIISLNPAENADSRDMNELSQVLYITYEDFSMLLTGDVTGEMESEICDVYDLIEKQKSSSNREMQKGIDVLKVAHHGSRYSTTEQFLERISPRYAIISAGKKNVYGHPHEETIERLFKSGSAILTTPECGAVTVEVNEDGQIEIESFIKPNG